MSIEYKTGILSGVGTVGGIGAVASTMSAAEITGTLATIGGIVGGGSGRWYWSGRCSPCNHHCCYSIRH